MDSVPMLAITGQVNSFAIGTDAFQEADIVWNNNADYEAQFLGYSRRGYTRRSVAAAYEIATTGRPGPVLIDFAKDAQNGKFEFLLAAED